MGLVIHPDVVTIGEDLRTPDELRADIIAQVAAIRWAHTQSFELQAPAGIALAAANGYRAPNDTDAKTNVMGAIIGFQLAGGEGSRQWKFADASDRPPIWVDLGMNDLAVLGTLMADSQQAAFDNEKTLVDALKAASDPATVDINAGWRK